MKRQKVVREAFSRHLCLLRAFQLTLVIKCLTCDVNVTTDLKTTLDESAFVVSIKFDHCPMSVCLCDTG